MPVAPVGEPVTLMLLVTLLPPGIPVLPVATPGTRNMMPLLKAEAIKAACFPASLLQLLAKVLHRAQSAWNGVCDGVDYPVADVCSQIFDFIKQACSSVF